MNDRFLFLTFGVLLASLPSCGGSSYDGPSGYYYGSGSTGSEWEPATGGKASGGGDALGGAHQGGEGGLGNGGAPGGAAGSVGSEPPPKSEIPK